jgi:hypothetical protein
MAGKGPEEHLAQQEAVPMRTKTTSLSALSVVAGSAAAFAAHAACAVGTTEVFFCEASKHRLGCC